MKATATITIHIDPADLVVPDQALPAGKVGQEIADAIQIKGGTPPYTVALVSGAVPTGTTLMDDGTIDGVPTAPGDYAFSVSVADAQG